MARVVSLMEWNGEYCKSLLDEHPKVVEYLKNFNNKLTEGEVMVTTHYKSELVALSKTQLMPSMVVTVTNVAQATVARYCATAHGYPVDAVTRTMIEIARGIARCPGTETGFPLVYRGWCGREGCCPGRPGPPLGIPGPSSDGR